MVRFSRASRLALSWLCASWVLVGSVVLLAGGLSQVGSLPAQAQEQAQDQAQPQEADSGDANMLVRRIGLIDLDGVIRSSAGTAKVRELLDKQRVLFQQEFTEREAKLRQTERELTAQRGILSEDAFAEKLSQFEADVATIQKEIQYRREAIDLAFQESQAKLRQIALEIVTEVAGERRLDLVLIRDSALIFLPSLNISDEVLRRLDERTKNARLEVTIDPPAQAGQE